ncbi:MAG: ABC transporter substrate-binding protein [Myxococcales bacterium]|nr:ABC transporter substrate-binding protein [Myxococcales bacterium]
MTRSAPIAASLALLALALLPGCPNPPEAPRWQGAGHEEPQYGGTFKARVDSNIRGLDPHVSFDENSNIGIRLLFDGLLDYDDKTKLVPSLATSMPELQPDGKTFRFTLRKGVYFHDSPLFPGGKGREVTADDVKWSLTHMMAPKTHSPGFVFFTAIEGATEFREGKAGDLRGVRVVDRYTVDITLEKPDQTFLNAMAMTFAYPVPKENYEAHPHDVGLHPVGTGPFVFEEWERDVRLNVTKNTNYWRKDFPYVDRIVVQEQVTPDVAAMRLRNGDIDHLDGPRQPDYIALRNAEPWKPYVGFEPGVTVWGIYMNCDMEPFTNVHLRRAVAFALDREKIQKVSFGRRRPTGQMLPPQLMGYREDLEHRQYHDLEKAKEEMRLAGYPNGLDQTVTFTAHSSETAKQLAEFVQEDLKQIGIKIEIRQVAFATYLQETGIPGRVQMAISGWNQDFPDPADFLDVLLHTRSIHPKNSENAAFYSNPVLDELLDRARIETDPAKREQMYVEANNIVAHDAPWAFLFNPVEFEAWQPYVKGYSMHPVWSKNFRSVWLDHPRRRVH